jgi:hypothetical protein
VCVCVGGWVKNRMCADKNLTLVTDFIYWNIAKCIVTQNMCMLKYVKQTLEANYSPVR